MKQLILMIALTLAGTVGVFVVEPFLGVWIYYLFAVLRPQFMWEWSLPPGVNWSRYVAVATLLALIGTKMGLLASPKGESGGQGPAPPLHAVHYVTAAFGVWIVLCYFLAPYHNPFWTDDVFVEYFKIFIMFFTATAIIRRFGQLWILFVMIGGTLAYIAYEMNFLYFVNNYLAIYRRGYAGLDNNGAALMLAMGVPVCLFLWDGYRRWYRWAFLAVIPVLIHAILMSYSRGAMLSLLVVSPLWLIRARRRVLLALVYGGVLAMLPLMAGKEIRERFFSIEQHEIDESARARRASWAAAIRMANENPIFGVGLRCSNMLSYRYGADMEGRTIHSQYLQIAADTGWAGMGLYVLMLFTAWLGLRRARRLLAGRDDEESRQARAVASGAEGALFVFCVGAAFLSLEVFELPYLVLLLMAQISRVKGVASPTARSLQGAEPAADVMPIFDPFPPVPRAPGASDFTTVRSSQ
jgi:probable O-glycosylation ligase (exosortase A-associated)